MLKSHASFIDPMLLLPAAELPEGDKWLIEPKLDGFRAIAFKTGGKVFSVHETTRISAVDIQRSFGPSTG
ncbi:MAG TPA: hypothetical protein VG297_17330 [Bryobacteraceae bacterium]|nr:hypothetical protein [Bryobacteraceae bacterium]